MYTVGIHICILCIQIGILDFIKIKTFCVPKNTIKRVRTWEKILVNYMSSNSQVSGIYKELLKFSNKRTTKLKVYKRIWTDISPRQAHKWSTSTRKDTQHSH